LAVAIAGHVTVSWWFVQTKALVTAGARSRPRKTTACAPVASSSVTFCDWATGMRTSASAASATERQVSRT
jgi:hypothetical protein